MIRIVLGLAMVAGAAYAGRRYTSGLSGPERSFVERALDDAMGFTTHQFPLLELDAGDDPRVTDPGLQMQCETVTPYLMAANRHLFEALSRGELGADSTRVLVAQMATAAAQPGRCPFRMPELLLEPPPSEED